MLSLVPLTAFGKHCECVAQKCTHLEHLPPLASHLLLLSHCVLTWHGGKKGYVMRKCILHAGSEPGSAGIKLQGQSSVLCKQCVLLCFIKLILGNQCTVPGFLHERAKGARTHD